MQGIIITDDRDTIDYLDIKVDLGDFNNLISGTYTIKYIVRDRDRNVTTFTRNILVIEEMIVIPPENNDSPTDEIKSENGFLMIFTGLIKSPFSWLFLLLLLILIFKRKKEEKVDVEEIDI